MYRFIFKMFVAAIGFIELNVNALNVIPLKCVSISNRECKTRLSVININSNEPLFYPCSILVNKYGGSC